MRKTLAILISAMCIVALALSRDRPAFAEDDASNPPGGIVLRCHTPTPTPTPSPQNNPPSPNSTRPAGGQGQYSQKQSRKQYSSQHSRRPQQRRASAKGQAPATLDWPEAIPVTAPKEEPVPTCTTGKGILEGDKNKTGSEDKGSKVIVKKKVKVTCFDDFDALKGKAENKPVMLFVYWPSKTDSKGRPSKVYAECQKFIQVLAHKDVKGALNLMDCYKVDFKLVDDKERRKRYRIKGAPTLIFIDATGKVLKRLTSGRIKPKNLTRVIKRVANASDKNLKRLQKKRERANNK